MSFKFNSVISEARLHYPSWHLCPSLYNNTPLPDGQGHLNERYHLWFVFTLFFFFCLALLCFTFFLFSFSSFLLESKTSCWLLFLFFINFYLNVSLWALKYKHFLFLFSRISSSNLAFRQPWMLKSFIRSTINIVETV